MRANVARVLRDRLGEEPTEALAAFVAAAGNEWKQDVLDTGGERFERRLSEECSKLRVEMAEIGAAIRVEMAQGFAGIRQEMGGLEGRLLQEMGGLEGRLHKEMGGLEGRLHKEIAASIRWSFLFWVGQVATIAAMLAFVFGRL